MQFSRSPIWRVPINNFIDDNCHLFDAEEEMKLEYTVLHQQFQQLIDGLLTSFVADLGVPPEEAMAAIKASMHSSSPEKGPTRFFIVSIFSFDDFRTFHRMMVKRNIELDILAAAQLKADGVPVDLPTATALQASSGPSTSSFASTLAMEANGSLDEEEALRAAIAASLQDTSIADKKAALTDAALQEEVAVSVKQEQERAAARAAEVEKEVQKIAQQDVRAAAQVRQEQLKAIEEQKEQTIQKLEQATLQKREENVRQALAAQNSPQPAAPAPAAVPAPAPAPAPAVPSALPPVTTGPSGGAARPSGRQPLPPIAAQPSLSTLQAQVAASNAGKAPTTAAPPAPSGAAKAKAASGPTSPPKASAGPSKEELEQRARHMREQRDRILAQNKAKRQQELKAYGKGNAAPKPAAPAATGAGASAGTTAEERQLTVDIARRLRDDIVNEARQ